MRWEDDALCATTDPDLFFPEPRDKAVAAKRICASCRVKDECLEYALEAREEHGVWGGLTEVERAALLEPVKPVLARLDYDSMAELLALNMPIVDIAARLGCSTESVSRFRKRLNARDAA